MTTEPTTTEAIPDKPKRKRKSIRRSVLVGGAIGSISALLLLIFFAIVVSIYTSVRAVTPESSQDPAFTVLTFLSSYVCLAVPFIFMCTFVGGVAGLIRSRM